MLRVEIPRGRRVLPHISGIAIRTLPVDKLMLEVSAYDLSKRRVIYRPR